MVYYQVLSWLNLCLGLPTSFLLPNSVSIVHLGFGSSTHDLSVDVHLGKMILWLAFWNLVSTAQLYQTIILSYIFLAGCNFEGFSAFSTWTWKGKIYFKRAKFSVLPWTWKRNDTTIHAMQSIHWEQDDPIIHVTILIELTCTFCSFCYSPIISNQGKRLWI